MTDGSVLVVDDDESMRQLLIECLADSDRLVVDGARDGVEALHQVSTHRYGVIVLDVKMPYMSGIDFLASLDALMSDPSIASPLDEPPAVLVITSAPQEDVPSDTLQRRFPAFVRGVMRKPLDIPLLASRVVSLLT
jgi:CheY-like chemotaxis protein